jgi:hypothetical protein
MELQLAIHVAWRCPITEANIDKRAYDKVESNQAVTVDTTSR